jgi:vitamin B12/bleomycin/antimicrobial peptide transport system ATP-binding/permease protein
MAASLVCVLWVIGGSLTLGHVTIPGYLVIAVVIYFASTSFSMLVLGPARGVRRGEGSCRGGLSL